MGKNRLEALSDGLFAIIITITVLTLVPPRGASLADLRAIVPALLTYLLSFVNLGIYWNNHHHMLMVTERVSGTTLWANLHLLFWLSLVPFITNWMGDTAFAPAPTALYGAVLLAAAIAYQVLQLSIIATQGRDSLLAKATGRDLKGKLSALAYAVAIPVAFVAPLISCALYAIVALTWLIPDPRIARVLTGVEDKS